MSSWAPHLLRLFQYTQKPIYEIYARNGIIGRYANYPGYYATGFTDIPMSKNFPYKGPDVSSVYYHHIPPHIAFSVDYLVTEAIQRSVGMYHFLIASRRALCGLITGCTGGKGRVFNDMQAMLHMRKGLVTIANPEINYVTAISDKTFWILLSSEADAESKINLKWSAAAGAKTTGMALEYESNGRSASRDFKASAIDIAVPAKGFKALAIPLETVTPLQHQLRLKMV